MIHDEKSMHSPLQQHRFVETITGLWEKQFTRHRVHVDLWILKHIRDVSLIIDDAHIYQYH